MKTASTRRRSWRWWRSSPPPAHRAPRARPPAPPRARPPAPPRAPPRVRRGVGSVATLAYKGEITYWNTMRDFEAAEVQKQLDAWQTLHPGITIKTDLVPFDGADKKYTDAANAGTAPDIMRADIGWTPTFADAGHAARPDQRSSRPTSRSSSCRPRWGPRSTRARCIGVPQVTDALGLQCNKTLLTAAGLSAAPTSWDELVTRRHQGHRPGRQEVRLLPECRLVLVAVLHLGLGRHAVHRQRPGQDHEHRRQLARVRERLDVPQGRSSSARSRRPPGTSRPPTTT